MTQYGPTEWWYANGQLAADQRAAVFGPGDNNAFAPIYADPGLTISLPNPTTTDALGMLTFYAADGQYFIFVGPEGSGDSVEVILGAAPGAVDSVNGQTGNVVLDATDVGADPAGSAAAAAAASQPLSTIDAKGDLYAGTGNNTTARRSVGADGEVLAADSSDPTGLTWIPPAGGAVDSVNGETGVVVLDATDVGADPVGSAAAAAAASQPLATINAKGDLYVGTANDATTRLPVGTDGQTLRANSGTGTGLEWDTLTAADVGALPLTGGTLTGDLLLDGPTTDLTVEGSITGTYQGVTVSAMEALSTALSTGVIYGGTMTVNADPSKVDITAILGYIVDYSTDPTAPTLTRIELPAQIGVPMDAGALSRTNTYWMIDSTGTLIQSATSPTRTERRSNLIIGFTAQAAGAIFAIASVSDQPNQLLPQLMDLARALGAFLVSGCTLSPNVGLTFERAPGQVFAVDGNQVASLADPHVVTTPAADPVPFRYATRASVSVAAPVTAIDPASYDVADVITPIPGSGNRATLQRVYFFAISNTVAVQYGQHFYDSLDDAINAMGTEVFIPNPILIDENSQGILLGVLAVTKGCTDLSDSATAQFFTFPKFSTAVSGVGGVTFGTTAGTAAEGNDARIVGAQQRSTLTTKGDLYVATASATTTRRAVGTDGQVLTADSTQADGVKWATPATAPVTSVNGEVGVVVLDAADVGAQPITTIDAKGDLYVGTADNATARQAVGTNGFTLLADSALANGLKWGVPPSAAMYPRSTGFVPAGAPGTARSSKSSPADTMFLSPIYILIGATLSTINFEATANIANAVVRLGIYGSDSAMLPTGAPIADYGTVAAATIGTKTLAVSTALAPGLYWIAAVGQTAAPTLRFCAGQSPWVASATFPAGSGVGWNNGYAQTGVSGTLPSIGTIADSDVPLLGLKF